MIPSIQHTWSAYYNQCHSTILFYLFSIYYFTRFISYCHFFFNYFPLRSEIPTQMKVASERYWSQIRSKDILSSLPLTSKRGTDFIWAGYNLRVVECFVTYKRKTNKFILVWNIKLENYGSVKMGKLRSQIDSFN